MKPIPLGTMMLCAATLSGCAHMTPGLGFDEVSQDVLARTGAETHWDRGTADDQAARRAVRELLSRDLTAETAAQIALLNNRDLQATYEDLDIAQADLVRAGLLRNPVFSGELRFDTGGGGTAVALDVAQDFLSILTLPLRRARGDAAFAAAKARVTRETIDTAFATRAAFYEYQAACEVRALMSTIEQATAASADLARRLFVAGNTRELDVLSEQALHEQSRLDLEAAVVDAAQSRERLNILMGLWGADTGWTTSDRLPPPPASELPLVDLERTAIAQSLDLAEARASVEQAAITAQLARPLSWLEGGEAGVAAERDADGSWSVGPSVSVPIPIFDLGRAASGESAARLRQTTHRYYAAAVRVRADARAAASALESARTRVLQHQTVILPLHERIVNQAQLQYNAMQLSAFHLLQAKKEQIGAAVSSVHALRGYWIARANGLRVLAGTTTDPSSWLSTSPSDANANRTTSAGGHS